MDFRKIRLSLAFGPKARSEFYDLLANFISDGIDTYNAIARIHKQYVIAKRPTAEITDEVMRAMAGQSGRALSPGQALSKFVPAMEAMTIDAGADAGSPHEGFVMAKRLCDNQQEARSVVLGEVLYPVFLLAMFFGVLIMVGHLMLPRIETVLPREKWTADARFLGWMGDHSIPIVIGVACAVAALVAAYFTTRETWTGKSRQFFDEHVFPWNVTCSINSAMLLSAVAVMLRSSVPFGAILDKLSRTSGPWMNYHFAAMRARLRRGLREGDSLAGELFDKETRWQIQMYGEVHNFGEGIDKLSVRVAKRILERVKAQFAVIRFALLIAVAFMVVWVYWTFLALTMSIRSSAGAIG